MPDFVLPLFPDGSLSSSVVTTTWIGVFVIAFFNLRFGWVLSGLVVPGYLVPLLIVKPWSAAVIVAEGCVTYFLVWLYSERLSGPRTWSALFGRDRFFALILASVAVRLVFDGWLLPIVGATLNQQFAIDFDYRNNLHSFGLIVISLLANQFWKPGFVRALVPVVVPIGITYLLVRYGLMEFTNFQISNLGYLYEDVAASILASPKSYIILITTAFLASRMNLRYGWDFNGILIPALIALQWYQPFKVLATFAEAFVIYGIAIMLLRLPIFANVTIEGARKVLLFFNISFAYKMILGYMILWIDPGLKTTDFFGFGYLLSTLIAIKMHDKDILARLTRATLQISLTGVAVGSVIASLLAFVPTPTPVIATATPGETRPRPPSDRPATLASAVGADEVRSYATLLEDDFAPPHPGEIERFKQAIGPLLTLGPSMEAAVLDEAGSRLAHLGYHVELLEERYVYLSDAEPGRGWGTFVIDLTADGALLLEVPEPLEARGLTEAGLGLFMDLGARALAIGGTDPRAARGADLFAEYQTFFQAFHTLAQQNDVVQLRELGADENSDLSAQVSEPGSTSGVLWVKAALPPGLDLARLERLAGSFDVRWASPPWPSVQWDTTRSGFAMLGLSDDALRRIRAFQPTTQSRGAVPVAATSVQGWILDVGKEGIAKPDEAYVEPNIAELLFFDDNILTPLIRLVEEQYRQGDWTAAGLDELSMIAAAAEAVDYELVQLIDPISKAAFVVLAPADARRQGGRAWGHYVFRLGPTAGYVVEVPRPLVELRTLEYGATLLTQLEARALLVSGAHAGRAEVAADPVAPGNVRTLFNLVHQVLLREHESEPLMVVQSRAYGFARQEPSLDQDLKVLKRPPAPHADVLVAFADGATQKDELGLSGLRLIETIEAGGLSIALVDGGAATAGYGVGAIPQALYLEHSDDAELAVLWLSPLLRADFRQADEVPVEQAQFTALGIPTRQLDLRQFLLSAEIGSAALPDELRVMIDSYVADRDVVLLRSAQRASAIPFSRLVDTATQQSFLLVEDASGRVLGLANLAPLDPKLAIAASPAPDIETVQRFLDTRAGWLTFGS